MARQQRLRQEVERTRLHILEAAARAFARSGYQAATMTAIAREAGYTAPTLYTYFKGKQDIFEALLALVLDEVLATYDMPVPRGLTFPQHLELLLTRQLGLIDKRSDAFAFLLTIAGGGDPGPRRDARRRHRDESTRLDDRLTAWIRERVVGHPLDRADPSMLTTFLTGITSSFLRRWVKEGRQRPAVELAPLIVGLFFDGAAGAVSRDGAP